MPTDRSAAYTPGCPDCGSSDGLLRVSEETALFTQPVKALRWWGPGRVRVEATGDKVYLQEGVRTTEIRCSACGYRGDPALFATEIVKANRV